MSLMSVTEEENSFYTKFRLLKKEALQHAENTAVGFAIFMKEGCGIKSSFSCDLKSITFWFWGFLFWKL